MQIGKQTHVVNGGAYSVPTNVGVVLCDTSKGACYITLPNILSSRADALGYRVIIQDIGNNASVNNITIVVSKPNEKVNGQSNVVISTNGGASLVNPFGDFYWIATNIGGSTDKFKYYKAILQQGKGGAPVITYEIENTFGEAPVFATPPAQGTFPATLTGIIAGRTIIRSTPFVPTFDGEGFLSDKRNIIGIIDHDDAFQIITWDDFPSSPFYKNKVDNVLNGVDTWIEIIAPLA